MELSDDHPNGFLESDQVICSAHVQYVPASVGFGGHVVDKAFQGVGISPVNGCAGSCPERQVDVDQERRSKKNRYAEKMLRTQNSHSISRKDDKQDGRGQHHGLHMVAEAQSCHENKEKQPKGFSALIPPLQKGYNENHEKQVKAIHLGAYRLIPEDGCKAQHKSGAERRDSRTRHPHNKGGGESYGRCGKKG